MRHATTLASGIDGVPCDRAYGATRRRGSTRGWILWTPLVVLLIAALTLRSTVVPWVFMWTLALALFAGCKSQTWWSAVATRPAPNWKRSAAYLLLWPGMDPNPFFQPIVEKREVRSQEWFEAVAKLLLGLTLVALSRSTFLVAYPLSAGWTGMIGLILLLHFGALHLVALGWQRIGIRAEPLMNRPLASKSLSDLWGKRWNRGFRTLAHKFVFQPVQRRYGPVAGTLTTFLASGLIHDFVISVPARSGYGLPTAYFLIQGLGVIAERSPIGTALGLGNGARGRVCFLFTATAPLPLLFHPWFVTRVMLPFLHAI